LAPLSILPFPATTIPPPPDELAEAGRQLWETVNERFVIEPVHLQVLKLACLSADSAAAMRARIKAEAETVTGSTGQQAAHPLLAAEGAAQKSIAAFMRQLGLFSEETRDRPGRPPKPFGGY
jgi:hypothetical protein